MAKNLVQDGRIITVTAPYALTSGQGCMVGSIFGVALMDIANGAAGDIQVEGVFDVTKEAVAVTAGAALYWDNTNRRLTPTPTGSKPVGYATQAQAGGDATARVRLTPMMTLTLSGSAVLNFGSIGAGLAADLTIAVVGAAATDPVAVGPPAAIEAGISVTAFVSAADTVTVRAVNNTAGAVDPASATFKVLVFKA